MHQQLGVRPDLGRGELEIVPQLPSDAPIAGERIRLGNGVLELVRARREARRYITTVAVGSAPVERLLLGHTLSRGSRVEKVLLDGSRVGHRKRLPNRGLEVTARAPASGATRSSSRR